MITPRLWRRALGSAAQWRLLLLWLAGLAIPALALFVPLRHILANALDHSPRAKALASMLDAEAMIDLLHLIGSRETGNALMPATGVTVLLALFISPLLAAGMVAAARSREPLRSRELLRGAGEGYGRMLRLLAVGLIPLGIAGGIGGAVIKAAGKRALHVYTEGSAVAGSRAAIVLTVVLVFLAHTTLDLARGMFAAEPDRRSAFFAWWHSVRLLVQRPLRVLAMALVGTLAGFAVAAALMLVRLQITQSSGATVLLALLVAQLALAALGWGRAARIVGFAELVRADAAERSRAVPLQAAPQTVPAEPAPESPALVGPPS